MQPSNGAENTSLGSTRGSGSACPGSGLCGAPAHRQSHPFFPGLSTGVQVYLPLPEGLPSGLETRTTFHQSYFPCVVTVTQGNDNTFT